MSNIARKPIKITEGVTINIKDDNVQVVGPLGTLEERTPKGVSLVQEDGILTIKSERLVELEKFAGLARALVANMVKGVTVGFERKLELTGVGYRARVEGEDLVLNVGFSVPIRINPPQGVKLTVDENVITVAGISKQLVGDVASKIRAVRPPDPYKGKGIKYLGEYIRRKVGKAAKAVGAAA